ncbi:MAG: M48 family metalloprotease [Pseudomonadota bacterium]|nr:MAG: hypothetical protein DIU74_10665 [Pseudomonadota bacterium]
MDRYEYEGLVRRLEAQADNAPERFRSKVVMLSVFAYVAVFAVLVGGSALVVLALVWAYQSERTATAVNFGLLALTLLPVLYTALRTFLMRLDPPEGRPLTRAEAPRLFDTLDKMRNRLRGPAIHHVLIDGEFNAAIMQRPRWGLFGGHTNYLVLGLPYLLGVPPNEVLATIAHEYGHLCGNHGKLGAWVYRQRRTFDAMYRKLQDSTARSWTLAAMATVLGRFMPYYNAYTFVLSRQNEYEADRTATELVGAPVNAQGLVRDTLLGEWIHERFWPKLYAQADERPAPAFKPYAAMRIAFSASYDEWATQERLAAALRRDSDLLDTHPSLRDRLDAIGQRATLPPPLERSAAEVLLGPTARKLIEEFDRDWWTRERANWEAQFHRTSRARARLAELSKRNLAELQSHELQELALLKADLESGASAKPVLEHLLRLPGGPYPKAAYLYGRILLAERDEKGLQYLVKAADADPSLAEEVGRIGYGYLRQHHGEAAAAQWWERFMSRHEAAAA